jgi:serine/threonine protein phosphatase 1
MTNRIIAIPDIHGRLDILNAALERVEHMDGEIVFLGDYIDRGPHSKEVIERLVNFTKGNERAHAIMGNHEWCLMAAFRGIEKLRTEHWLTWGGKETLISYGLTEEDLLPANSAFFNEKVRRAVPASHQEWIYNLPEAADFEHHTFVHAGMNPNRSRPGVSGQSAWDLMWIRDEFLEVDHDFGKHIVYGHTIHEEPNLRKHSTGLDVGAYLYDRLCIGVFDRDAGGGPIEIIEVIV